METSTSQLFSSWGFRKPLNISSLEVQDEEAIVYDQAVQSLMFSLNINTHEMPTLDDVRVCSWSSLSLAPTYSILIIQ